MSLNKNRNNKDNSCLCKRANSYVQMVKTNEIQKYCDKTIKTLNYSNIGRIGKYKANYKELLTNNDNKLSNIVNIINRNCKGLKSKNTLKQKLNNQSPYLSNIEIKNSSYTTNTTNTRNNKLLCNFNKNKNIIDILGEELVSQMKKDNIQSKTNNTNSNKLKSYNTQYIETLHESNERNCNLTEFDNSQVDNDKYNKTNTNYYFNKTFNAIHRDKSTGNISSDSYIKDNIFNINKINNINTSISQKASNISTSASSNFNMLKQSQNISKLTNYSGSSNIFKDRNLTKEILLNRQKNNSITNESSVIYDIDYDKVIKRNIFNGKRGVNESNNFLLYKNSNLTDNNHYFQKFSCKNNVESTVDSELQNINNQRSMINTFSKGKRITGLNNTLSKMPYNKVDNIKQIIMHTNNNDCNHDNYNDSKINITGDISKSLISSYTYNKKEIKGKRNKSNINKTIDEEFFNNKSLTNTYTYNKAFLTIKPDIDIFKRNDKISLEKDNKDDCFLNPKGKNCRQLKSVSNNKSELHGEDVSRNGLVFYDVNIRKKDISEAVDNNNKCYGRNKYIKLKHDNIESNIKHNHNKNIPSSNNSREINSLISRGISNNQVNRNSINFGNGFNIDKNKTFNNKSNCYDKSNNITSSSLIGFINKNENLNLTSKSSSFNFFNKKNNNISKKDSLKADKFNGIKDYIKIFSNEYYLKSKISN